MLKIREYPELKDKLCEVDTLIKKYLVDRWDLSIAYLQKFKNKEKLMNRVYRVSKKNAS